MDMWTIWLILAGFFFIAEILTAGFLICWLGVGALIAMAISFLVDNLVIQIIVFAISSIILILSTKPLVRKFVDKKTIITNAYSLIGKKGLVIEEINSMKGTGQVKVNGEVWSAKGENDTKIAIDSEVLIQEIVGVKVVVKLCNDSVKV